MEFQLAEKIKENRLLSTRILACVCRKRSQRNQQLCQTSSRVLVLKELALGRWKSCFWLPEFQHASAEEKPTLPDSQQGSGVRGIGCRKVGSEGLSQEKLRKRVIFWPLSSSKYIWILSPIRNLQLMIDDESTGFRQEIIWNIINESRMWGSHKKYESNYSRIGYPFF